MDWKSQRNTVNADRFIGGAYIVVVRKSIKSEYGQNVSYCVGHGARARHMPCTISAAIILLLDDSIAYILHIVSYILTSSLREQGSIENLKSDR